MSMRKLMTLGLCALALSATLPAAAQLSKPMRMIIPFSPGGGTDIVGRYVAERLGTLLDKTVIVENRAGSGGMVGAEAVANAEPDGQTLLFGTSAELTIAPGLHPNLRYNPLRSFTPITLVGSTPSILLAKKDFDGKDIGDIIRQAKAEPGKVMYASGGTGTAPHLSGELLADMAQVNMVHVPYKGSGPAQSDLLGGHISLLFSTVAPSVPLIQQGKVKPIAVTSARRSSILPNVPTIAEQGYPGYDVSIWYALLAPAGMAPELAQTLRAATEKIVQEPAFIERMATLGVEGPTAEERGAEALQTRIRNETEQWMRLIKKAKISAQ